MKTDATGAARGRLPRLLALLLCLAAKPATAAGVALVLAVPPYLPAAEIHKRFGPLASYMAVELGRPVSVRVGQDYSAHIAAIGEDRVDIAFMGPASYVMTVDRHGRKPLLARFEVNGQAQLHGAVVVRRDSPLKGLADLKGKRFAFGDPQSTTSHVVPRYMLEQAGVPLDALGDHAFLGAHENVALAVLAGDFDAGAVKQETLEKFAPRGLRALAMTPGVADYLFVTRSDLPPADVERLRRALLRLKDRPGGKAILEGLHRGMTALIAAEDADYDTLRPMVRAIAGRGR